jgi:hypothetical protein
MSECHTTFLHGKASREILKDFVRKLARNKGIRVGRATGRTKDSLICWFYEAVPELLTGTAINESWKPDDPLEGLFAEFEDQKFDSEEE